ncbi:MAG: hypothetical protein AAFR38_10740 [Planctomycetota bacterium]
MTTQGHIHADHPHKHGPNCGHTAVKHEGHVDYLHEGHLHHQDADGTVVEHVIPVSDTNPATCNRTEDGVEPGHVHGPGCGHEPVPHGDHVDYLVDGRLQHQHGDHIDDHGPIELV